MPNLLSLFFILLLSAAAADAAAFQQFVSERFYYQGITPPVVAPFPCLVNLSSPVVAVQEPYLLSADGTISVLFSSGNGTSTLSTNIPPVPEAIVTITSSGHLVQMWASGGFRFSCPMPTPWFCSLVGTYNYPSVGLLVAVSEDTNGTLWLGGQNGLIRIHTDGSSDTVPIQGSVTSMAVSNADVAVGTTLAVYYDFQKSTQRFGRWVNANGESMDGTPTSLAFLEGELWIGGEWCLNVVRRDGFSVDRVSGLQGLPVGNVTSLAVSPDGSTLWIATTTGVVSWSPEAASEDAWRYFMGDRWIPTGGDSTVLAIAGSGWVATKYGLGHIYSVDMTMEEKSQHYVKIATGVMSRYGWVASASLQRYGDPTSILKADTDNDGLWTGELASGLIHEYAVTGSESIRQLAWKHYAAVEFLHNVTNTDGFFARTAVKCGEPHQGGDGSICPSGSPNTCGWVNSTACYDGVDTGPACCWTWKRDTSSDEVTGHFFTMFQAWLYLAQTAEEKQRVASKLCASADYLVKGGLKFIDPVSGRGTTWGYWDPAELNGVPGKPNERGGNALEILSFMASAARVCNDSRYGETFASLVRDDHYDENIVNALATSPQSLAFFDIRLDAMSYHLLTLAVPELAMHNGTGYDPILPLTKEEQRTFQSRLKQSVSRYWENKHSFGATVYGLNNYIAMMELNYKRITGNPSGLSDPQWQLKRYPLDLIAWPVQNSRRWDIQFLKDWSLPPNNQKVLTRALPADEAFGTGGDFLTEGSTDGVDGGDGRTYQMPSPWMLLYWMQRHYV